MSHDSIHALARWTNRLETDGTCWVQRGLQSQAKEEGESFFCSLSVSENYEKYMYSYKKIFVYIFFSFSKNNFTFQNSR